MLPHRYWAFVGVMLLFAVTAEFAIAGRLHWVCTVIPGLFVILGVHSITQTRHSVLRNYPFWGHFRFLFKFARPEIRRYFVEDDMDERPFLRAQHSTVYQRAKGEVDSRPSGTEVDVKVTRHEWVGHSLAPTRIALSDFRAMADEGRAKPYSVSVFGILAMSFGALSDNAIRALDRGMKLDNFIHGTGESSISSYHRAEGGDLVWEVASGYFGCRDANGRFDPGRSAEQARSPQVKMIKVELSQDAKSGHGSALPAVEITPEIATTRGIQIGKDCISPAVHSEFSAPLGLLQFVDRLRTLPGGKPTGFKLCIGYPWESFDIVKTMLDSGVLPDFIVIDDTEGGTGVTPLEFADHVGTPLQEGPLLVHSTLVGTNLRDRIKIGVSGRIVTALDVIRTLAMGTDQYSAARGFMFALSCIRARKCHTDRCPTGVTTRDPSRQEALVMPGKAEYVYQYHTRTLHALLELTQAAGLQHPAEFRAHHIVRRVSGNEVQSLSTLLKYLEPGDLLAGRYRYQLYKHYWPMTQAERFDPMVV